MKTRKEASRNVRSMSRMSYESKPQVNVPRVFVLSQSDAISTVGRGETET